MLGKINWKPERRDIRYFAFTLGIVAVLLALVVLAASSLESALHVLAAGLLLSGLCYFVTPVGRLVYLIWMAVTFLLNWIVSPIVTSIIYYLVLTPIGLFYRLTGRDELRLKKPEGRDSYFDPITEEVTREGFERQF